MLVFTFHFKESFLVDKINWTYGGFLIIVSFCDSKESIHFSLCTVAAPRFKTENIYWPKEADTRVEVVQENINISWLQQFKSGKIVKSLNSNLKMVRLLICKALKIQSLLTIVGTWPGMICCCICWARAFFNARWLRPFISNWSWNQR